MQQSKLTLSYFFAFSKAILASLASKQVSIICPSTLHYKHRIGLRGKPLPAPIPRRPPLNGVAG